MLTFRFKDSFGFGSFNMSSSTNGASSSSDDLPPSYQEIPAATLMHDQLLTWISNPRTSPTGMRHFMRDVALLLQHVLWVECSLCQSVTEVSFCGASG